MYVLRNLLVALVAGISLISTAAISSELRELQIAPGIQRPDLRMLQLPDLYVPKGGVNCPYGTSLVATGPEITTPFIMQLGIDTLTEGAWIHRRTLDVKASAVGGSTYVKFPFSQSMLGSDIGDVIRCSVHVDVGKQITEAKEKNNTAVTEISGLLGNDERQ